MKKIIKRICIIVLILILFSNYCIFASAHQGKTDSAGGHNDYANGDYHYHHGYSAHYHPNGICPYDEEKNEENYYEEDYEEYYDYSIEEYDGEDYESFEDYAATYQHEDEGIIEKDGEDYPSGFLTDKEKNIVSVVLVLVGILLSYLYYYIKDKRENKLKQK